MSLFVVDELDVSVSFFHDQCDLLSFLPGYFVLIGVEDHFCGCMSLSPLTNLYLSISSKFVNL